jgi:hypothetical protein
MSRSSVYVLLIVLAIVAATVGYQLYQERQKTSGIELHLDDHGISLQQK